MPPPSPRTGLPHTIPPVPVPSGVGVASSLNRRHSYNTHNQAPNVLDTFASSFKPYKFDPLFIEDPLAFENNVGRNCFRVHQVQKLWSETHSELLQRIYAIERGSSTGCLLDLLVGSETVQML